MLSLWSQATRGRAAGQRIGLRGPSFSLFPLSMRLGDQSFGDFCLSLGLRGQNFGEFHQTIGLRDQSFGEFHPSLGLRRQNFGEFHQAIGLRRQNFGEFHQTIGLRDQSFGLFTLFFPSAFPAVPFFPLVTIKRGRLLWRPQNAIAEKRPYGLLTTMTFLISSMPGPTTRMK
jgi:hypothetical protein